MTPLEACHALAKVTPASAKVGPKGDRVSLSTLLSAATQANAEERLREGLKWFREKRQNHAKPAALLWAFEALGEQPWPDPPAPGDTEYKAMIQKRIERARRAKERRL